MEKQRNKKQEKKQDPQTSIHRYTKPETQKIQFIDIQTQKPKSSTHTQKH